VCGKSGEKLTDHTAERDQRTDRVTQEINAKTSILATDLAHHIKKTENDIQAVKKRNYISQTSAEQRYR
jgi:hypothetical protein